MVKRSKLPGEEEGVNFLNGTAVGCKRCQMEFGWYFACEDLLTAKKYFI